jgi:hypothetical protein
MKASTLLSCTARPTALHAHWSSLAGGVVLIIPMVHIDGTNVCNPWLIDSAHCLDTENLAVWNGNVLRLLGTAYHTVPSSHHLSTVLTEIGSRKPGKRANLAHISPFEFPSEVAQYLFRWHNNLPLFTWSENKSYVIDETPVWFCVSTSRGCWRFQQVRGGVDPAYASPADWLPHDRPASALKRSDSPTSERKSPKKKKHRPSLPT